MDVAKIEIFVGYFFQKQNIQIFLHCKNWKRIQKRIQRNIQIFFLCFSLCICLIFIECTLTEIGENVADLSQMITYYSQV